MTELVTLQAGDARLVLAPTVGGGVFAWTRGEYDMFRPSLPGALEANLSRDLASYPLFPYSNRVAGRRFSFGGATYELPQLLRSWAIHGAGWQLPWNATQAGNTATLSLDYPGGTLWPFAFHAEQTFTLTPTALTSDLSIRNEHPSPAPAGFGQHPFFPRSPEMRLQFTAETVMHNGPDMLPTHTTKVPPEWDHTRGLPVGPLPLDNCFTAWGGAARLIYPDRGYSLAITADPVFHHLIVYIPPGQPFMAVEPVSNATDGLNRMDSTEDHGIFVLQPGETKHGLMRFSIENG
jgi:aldose 1-epimerase